MRAVPNLLEEVEVLDPGKSVRWSQVWGAEVLGRAIGHEIRYLLESIAPADEFGGFGYLIDSSLPLSLVQHHVADVL